MTTSQTRLTTSPIAALVNRVVPLTFTFNGSCPGPTIQVNQGDRVRIVLENHLPESTAIHWHGLEIPYAMDGMPYLSQRPIAPGSRFAYEFTVHQNGTFFYHSHSPMQQMMGMVGLFFFFFPINKQLSQYSSFF